MSAFSSFFIVPSDPSIEFDVIEADGSPLFWNGPYNRKAKSVEVQAGQRYSIRVEKPAKNFLLYAVLDPYKYSGNSCQRLNDKNGQWDTKWYSVVAQTMCVQVEPGNTACPTPVEMIFRYNSDGKFVIDNPPARMVDPGVMANDEWVVNGYMKPRDGSRTISGTAADSRVINVALTATNGGKGYANMNNKIWQSDGVPVLVKETQPKDCTSETVDPYAGVNNREVVSYGTKVYMQIKSDVGAHPFHLHGYNFQGGWRRRLPMHSFPSSWILIFNSALPRK